MACLFCGKDIGPIRLIRDREFCSPKHRKEYKDRLQKVLVQVGESETVPTHVSPFIDPVRAQNGSRGRSLAAFDFSTSQHSTRIPQFWTLTIPPAGSSISARLLLTAFDVSASPARGCQSDAFPYFSKSAAAKSLALPEAQLGAVVLRSEDGQLLSASIAVGYQPARSESPATSLDTAFQSTPPRLALPEFGVSAAPCEEMTVDAEPEEASPAPSTTWMPGPALEPLVSAAQASMADALPANTSLHLPQGLPAEAAVHPPLSEVAPPPEPCEAWMRGPAAEPVASIIAPSLNGVLPVIPPVCLPAAQAAPALTARPEVLTQHLSNLTPVAAEARPAAAAHIAALSYAAPDVARLSIPNAALPIGNGRYLGVPESEGAACEAQPSAACQPVAFQAAPLRLTSFSLAPVFDAVQPVAEEAPAADAPAVAPPLPAAAKSPVLDPVVSAPAARSSKPVASRPSLKFPKLEEKEAIAQTPCASGGFDTPSLEAVPYGDLLTVEYNTQLGPQSPLAPLHWTTRAIDLKMPRFGVRPVFDRLEDATAPKPARKTPAFAEIFSMPDAARFTRSNAARHAITAIAASVTVVMALWFGANAGKFGRDVINRDASEIAAVARSHSGASGLLARNSEPSQPAPSPLTSPVAWVRTAAAKRAAVQFTDSFKEGMEAWGAKAKAMAPGWSRNADGYVRPGQLALFQPSLKFTDYRMEFFGQLENKSMSWVVRGKDEKNYYAMKFNVVEPGLRPIISMEHYPVVGGKAGQKVEMPLSVMVHNNTPYHVAVEVKGSHYTASIEGQEVDEWNDDSLLAGGVGFFSEAGAKARIYWMKVSKNDDWFGRICGYLSGGDSQPHETAWLDRPQLPEPAPERRQPASSAGAIWTAEAVGIGWGRRRGRSSVKGERDKWSS